MLDPSIPLSGVPVKLPDVFGKMTQMRDLNDQRKIRQQAIADNDMRLEEARQARDRKAEVAAIIKGSIKVKMGAIPAGGIPGGQPAPNVAPPGVTAAPAMAQPQTLAGLAGPMPTGEEPPVPMPSQPGQPPLDLQGTPDWDMAIAQMRARGFEEEARFYEDGRRTRLSGLLKDYGEKNSVINSFFRQAGGAVSEVLDKIEAPNPVTGMPKTDTEKQALYQTLRPQLAAALPGPLGNEVPVQYSRAALETLRVRGMTAAEHTDALVKFAKLGEEAVANDQKREQNYTLMLASALPTATNQQEWDAILERVRLHPGGRAVADSFPQTISADAKTRARDRGIAAKDQADLEIQRQREQRLRAAGPAKPDLSPAQRGVSERWKHTELRTLEKAIRDGVANGTPLSADQIAAEKLRIQNGYLAQLGEDEQAELGPEWTSGTAKAAPKPDAPARTAAKAAPAVAGSKGTITLEALKAKAAAWGLTEAEARKRAVDAGYIVQ